jgi:tRNA pseudouridine38-40 synthase
MKAFWEKRGRYWVFTIQADRFLRNMVRAVVGTLMEVGRGKMDEAGFKAVIESKDRCKAGTSVHAQGLFLIDVSYPEDLFLK